MKKLIIEIPLEGNDLEETDFQVLLQEVERVKTFSGGLNVEVGGPVDEENTMVTRTFGFSAEYFDVRLEDN